MSRNIPGSHAAFSQQFQYPAPGGIGQRLKYPVHAQASFDELFRYLSIYLFYLLQTPAVNSQPCHYSA
jgi:hypothetical protein